MKILFLTSRIPYPPNRGDKLRVYNFIKRLSTNHEIFLVSFIANQDEKHHIQALNDYCSDIKLVLQSPIQSLISVAKSFLQQDPMQVSYYRSKQMKTIITSICQTHRFDIVYAHLARMAPYASFFSNAYKIIDLTDLITEEIKNSLRYRKGISKLIYKNEFSRLAKFELEIINQFQEVWLISPYEQKLLNSRKPGANIIIVKNGISIDYNLKKNVKRVQTRLIFVGHMGIQHNIDAVEYLCLEILPGIRKYIPNIECQIVGAEPDRRVKRLDNLPGVQVLGYVEDLASVLCQAGMFVAPLRFSAGTQNKILEAMATGTAVITSKNANFGIGGENGKNILLAEKTDEYISLIIEMIQNPEKCDQIGKEGVIFVNENFSWDHVNERIQTIQNNLNQAVVSQIRS